MLSADHWQEPPEDDGERAFQVGLPKGGLSEVTARRGMEPHKEISARPGYSRFAGRAGPKQRKRQKPISI